MLYRKAEDRTATNKFHSVLTYFIKLHRLLSFLSLLWLLRQHKKQLNNYFHNQQDKKWDITPLFKRRKTGCGKKSHAKIHKTQEQQAQIPPPSADPTSKSRKYCKMVCCVICRPHLTDHWEIWKDKMQSDSTCFGNYKNCQRKKRHSKNLRTHDKKEE